MKGSLGGETTYALAIELAGHASSHSKAIRDVVASHASHANHMVFGSVASILLVMCLCNVTGFVGDEATTMSGVRQGCLLSATLFGVFIDALEFWLSENASGTGVSLTTPHGMPHLLSSHIREDKRCRQHCFSGWRT